MQYITDIRIIRLAIMIGGMFFLSGIWTEAEATHIVGGNLTYKHIGGTSYQVKLTLRRDCYLGSPEAEFDDPAAIGVFTAGGDLAKWIPGLVNGQLLLPFMASDTLNEYIKSDCGFEGTQVCVHETTYQGTVNLPFRAGGYVLAYQRCCRNGSLNNVLDPLETGTTYWVAISDEALTMQNSSPSFSNWPDVYICKDKPLVFDHSAIDVDGDSLVYSLCVPNSGASRNFPKPQPPGFPPYSLIDFAPPYSLSNLMGGVPLVIDPHTGIMTATPDLVGQFLIGVCVEEYRNGKLIGVIRRDFQFNVRVCSQPPLAQFATSESNCDGLTVEFYNNSIVADNFVWNFNYPDKDPSFISTEVNPTFTFPQSGIYQVHLMATRGSDQCFDTLVQTVAVFENKITSDFTYLLNGCDGNNDSLQVFLIDQSIFDEPGYALEDWQWTVTQNGSVSYYSGNPAEIKVSTSGNLLIKLAVSAENGCISELEKEVDIRDLVPAPDFTVTLKSCPSGDEVELELTDISQLVNPYAILEHSEWLIGNQTFTGSPYIIRVPRNVQEFEVILKSTFRDACDASIRKVIALNDLLPFVDVAMEYDGCPDDTNVDIRLVYIDTLARGVAEVSFDWLAGIAPNFNSYTGRNFSITIPKDSVLHYSLKVVFANGCVDSIQVDTIPGPFASLVFNGVPVVLCPNETKSILLNGNKDWTYTWSPTDGLDLSDPADPKVSSNGTRTYFVTVTDGLCTVSDSIQVIMLDDGIELSIIGDSIICGNEVELTALGGVGIGTYSWSDDPRLVNVIATGDVVKLPVTQREKTFYVSFIGEACSTQPASFTVVDESPVIDNLSPFRFCREDTARILILNQIPSHNNVYSWENDPHVISGHGSNEPIIGIGPNETGSFVLYYNVSNQFGCALRDSVVFNIEDNPVVDFTYDLTECGSYQVCFTANGQYEGFLFWDFGDPLTEDDRSLEDQPCYEYSDGGLYTVVLSNRTVVCPFKDIVKELQLNPLLKINPLGTQVGCLDDTIRLVATSNLNNVDFHWEDVNGNIVSTNEAFSTIVGEDAIYVVKAIDNNGCEAVDTVLVHGFRFSFDVAVDGRDSLCVYQPSQIFLDVDNPDDYEIHWYPEEVIVSGQNTAQPVVLLGDHLGISVRLTHKPTGCSDSASVNLNIATPFDFDVSTPDLACFDQATILELIIDHPESYEYIWSPNEAFSDGQGTRLPVLKVNSSQIITVEVVNKSNGCSKSLNIPIEVGDPFFLDVEADPNATINEGESVELHVVNVVPGVSYSWSNGEEGTSIVVSPEETTTYIVTGIDKDGCLASDTITVTVRNAKCDETDVYIPNAFTPNGDGSNDIFIPRSHFIDEMELIIFNRWGQEIFKSTDKTVGWDGTFNGKPVSPDAYAYYLKVICVNAETYLKRGNVTLIR